jgi:hypothetical protein
MTLLAENSSRTGYDTPDGIADGAEEAGANIEVAGGYRL